MYISSNVTPEEFFKYYCTDENALRFYEEVVDETEDSSLFDEDNSLENLERENDDLQERIEFLEGKIQEFYQLFHKTENKINREMFDLEKEIASIMEGVR